MSYIRSTKNVGKMFHLARARGGNYLDGDSLLEHSHKRQVKASVLPVAVNAVHEQLAATKVLNCASDLRLIDVDERAMDWSAKNCANTLVPNARVPSARTFHTCHTLRLRLPPHIASCTGESGSHEAVIRLSETAPLHHQMQREGSLNNTMSTVILWSPLSGLPAWASAHLHDIEPRPIPPTLYSAFVPTERFACRPARATS